VVVLIGVFWILDLVGRAKIPKIEIWLIINGIGVAAPNIATSTLSNLTFNKPVFQHVAMPNSRQYDAADIAGSGEQEQSSLLAAENGEAEAPAPPQPPHRRQSSLIQTPPNGAPRTPRTSKRVRFEVEERRSHETNGQARTGSLDSEDSLEEVSYILGGRRSSTGQRAPLLTDVEAPSVTAALEFSAEDLLESARPKSGMRSAFMNMANSIIGAGIIGMSRNGTR